MEKTIMFVKIEGSRKRGRPNIRLVDSIKEVTATRLQQLIRAVEDRAWRTSPIHRVTKSLSQFSSTKHT